MRVVLDANVLIAAYAARGLCEAVVEYCLATDEIILTEELLSDVESKLVRKIRVPAADAGKIVQFLRRYATIVKAAKVPAGACRDPDDADILGAAHAAKTEFIVTGDEDLLVLREYLGTRIVRLREYWEELAKRQ